MIREIKKANMRFDSVINTSMSPMKEEEEHKIRDLGFESSNINVEEYNEN